MDPDGEIAFLVPLIVGALEVAFGFLTRWITKKVLKQAVKKITPIITVNVIKYGKILTWT